MKIELRKITYNARLSQETSAYAADVWIDGVKRGSVQNAGHGGPDMVYPQQLAVELYNYAKTLPPTVYQGMTLDASIEGVFGDLLQTHLVTKDLTRALKTKTLFTVADGKIYSVKGHGPPPKDAILVLNNMPFDEALKVFRRKP